MLAAIHGRRAKAKKRARRLNFAFAMGLLVLLVAPVTAFTLHSRHLGTTDIAAPGSDPILSPAATAAATASAPPAATPLRALTEQEALQAARACFESVCDTSVFSFDEYAVSCERQGDAYFVLMTSIYGNGCTFSVTVDALTGEILQHSPVDLATQPASDAAVSAEAKTWTQKFGSNLFSWSAADQAEYARRYKGATLREPRGGEIPFEQAAQIASQAAKAVFEANGLSADAPLCYPMLYAERADENGAAHYRVFCFAAPPAEPATRETYVLVTLNPATGKRRIHRICARFTFAADGRRYSLRITHFIKIPRRCAPSGNFASYIFDSYFSASLLMVSIASSMVSAVFCPISRLSSSSFWKLSCDSCSSCMRASRSSVNSALAKIFCMRSSG